MSANENGATVEPSYETLFEEAGSLTNPAPPGKIEDVLTSLVKQDFSEIQTETLLTLISKKSGLPKRVLKSHYDGLHLKTFGILSDPVVKLALRVIDKHFAQGKHLRVTNGGEFERYQGTHWTDFPDLKLRARIMDEVKDSGIVDNGSVTATVGRSLQCIRDLQSGNTNLETKHSPENIVNTPSGELHLSKDGSYGLKPHSPESNLSTCLPFPYDPNAKCPLFEGALKQIFSETEDYEGTVRHLMEVIGYALQPYRDIAAFVVFYGTGANGKTSILKTLEHLLPPDAVLSQSMKRFMSDSFAEASLKGKLLLIDDDFTERLLLDDALIKRISENKQVTARGAYKKSKETFTSTVLPVLAGNSLPRTNDVSNGMMRRTLLFPFEKQFSKTEQNPKLFETIWETELPGILNLALEGLARLRQRGHFQPSSDCERALYDFIIQANPLTSFIESECIIDGEARTPGKQFRAAYRAWAKEQGAGHVDAADLTLKRKLEDLGFKVGKTKGVAMFHGLGLDGHNVV